ncbi:MAG: HAMP domain-containing histidine kinase [Lachnospiraceae bacterium]|nr:HAMP domain-containing histidine kinase [Lachnospiraceae bacterium]
MKDNYELKQLKKHLAVCMAVSLPLIWLVSWCFCEFHIGRAFLITGLAAGPAVAIGWIAYSKLRRLYQDVEDISELMVEVVDGNVTCDGEVYKQGTMGLLYTNYYKMVTALRESRMKEGREKEFLRDTISDISHQLKTPLASLKVFVELLYDDKIKEEEERKKVLREAGNQLNRMEWMVLAMLKLARIEAGSVQFEKRRCDVREILYTAMEAVDYLLEKRHQRIELVLSEALEEESTISLLCDKEWLTEAIINLLKNASDYSPKDTAIKVFIEENNLFTAIHIEDEGVGIPEEALHHIFKRFYRVSNEVNPGSVGIGLSLTKSIVEGMGGRIAVRSEVGKYTRFTIRFMK